MIDPELDYSTVAMKQVQGSDKKRGWKVSAGQAGIRMEAFVRLSLPHLSRRQAIKAIAEEAFLINGKATKKGYRLRQDDVVTLDANADWLSELPRPSADLQVAIVYEDAEVLAVNKPGGMPTHGFSGRDKETLANFLIAARPELSTVGKSRWEPGLVNRLDRETSGLVVVAKSRRAFDHLRAQFRRRQVAKSYVALVWGDSAPWGRISFPLVHDSTDKSRMRAIVKEPPLAGPRVKSWSAQTRFRKLASSKEMSLLEIEMETGVTHQIRVHLAAIGHPIIADAVYGSGNTENLGLRRHFLHARRLQFLHPAKSERIDITAPLPSDLREVLKRLKISDVD